MVNVINVILFVYSHYGRNVIFGYNLDKHERIRISLDLNCTGLTFFEISFKVYLFWFVNLWAACSSAGSLNVICQKPVLTAMFLKYFIYGLDWFFHYLSTRYPVLVFTTHLR